MSRFRLATAAVVLAVPALAQQPPVRYPYGQQPPLQAQGLPPLQRQWEDRGQAPVPAPLPPSRTFAPPSPAATWVPPLAPLVADETPSLRPSPPAPSGLSPRLVAPVTPMSPSSPALSGPDMTPLPRSNVWVPAGVARFQALDKVNAQTTTLTVKVGQSATFGSLTIVVKACMVRPPDQAADAAAFIDVTDSHPDSPSFNGWLLGQEPSASMMEHPIYDIRVTGCA